jgi:Virulence-associated protein E
VALVALGITFKHDIFHNKKIVEGDIAENISGELSDAICRALRDVIIVRLGFDPGKENVQEAAERACEIHRFDPVCDYLDGLQWDGQSRLDTWVIRYLGAEDTPLNRAFGRKMLIAAVRRARKPGCKFDYVPVLEGKTRTGKSSALRILALEQNFSDQPILHLDTRAQQEQIAGVWIYELSELAGMKRTDVETLKNFRISLVKPKTVPGPPMVGFAPTSQGEAFSPGPQTMGNICAIRPAMRGSGRYGQVSSTWRPCGAIGTSFGPKLRARKRAARALSSRKICMTRQLSSRTKG